MSKSSKKLRIAHVAPLFASVPPTRYGGTERVLDWLIREQIKAGHDVTLFASGDSKTKAKLVPVIPRALWREKNIEFPNTYHTIELDMVDKREDEFDIIHSHFNFIHFQSIHQIETSMVTTLHWRVDIREFQDLYNYFKDAPLIAISHSQKATLPQGNVVSVIYHGLPVEDYPFGKKGEGYLAFIGRMSPEKGIDIALKVAKKLGMPIKIGARMPETQKDVNYYENIVKPLMKSSTVEYLGELNESEKLKLLKGATATLIPTCWPEPFGLVTVEALCCGSPVVVFPMGGTGEIVKNGEVGYAVSSEKEMIAAVRKIDKIDRKRCREYIKENFSSSVMAGEYEKVYNKLLKNRKGR